MCTHLGARLGVAANVLVDICACVFVCVQGEGVVPLCVHMCQIEKRSGA